MITNWTLLVGLVLGVALTAINIVVELRRKNSPSLAICIVLFLASAGVAAGLRVCWLALDPTLPPLLSDELLYVFLGGVAVIWVSVETIIKHLRPSGR